MRGARWMRSYISLDGKHAVCKFEGPDAESVREAFRTAGLPFDRRGWSGCGRESARNRRSDAGTGRSVWLGDHHDTHQLADRSRELAPLFLGRLILRHRPSNDDA